MKCTVLIGDVVQCSTVKWHAVSRNVAKRTV